LPSLIYISFFQLEYPSALGAFEKIIDHANDKKIAIFLDYDGTLSPIVEDPDCAFMSEPVSNAFLLTHLFFSFKCYAHIFLLFLKIMFRCEQR